MKHSFFAGRLQPLLSPLIKSNLLTICLLAVLGSGLSARADSRPVYLACLTNFESYAETLWHPAAYPGAPADAGYWGDGTSDSQNNGGIRGNSGIAVAYAVLVTALPDDPRTPHRLERIRQALNYDAATHFTGTNVCVDGKPWGWRNRGSGDWQTPLWAGSMGLACVLMESRLPAATVDGVRRVVACEADHRAAIPPPSNHVNDTKAEENAWQGNIIALAAAWLSTSNHAGVWLKAAKKYLANTYTVGNTNGDPLAGWLTTVNVYDDWAMDNHGFYHPTYEMVAGMSSGDSLLMAQLANPGIAAQLQPFAGHNVMKIWNNNLRGMVMDSGDFAYPAGLDWELHDYEQVSFIAWLAAHFNDPVARWDDGRLAQLIRYRQEVNGDGEFVGPSGGGFYREAVEARRVAIAWLQWQYADFPDGPSTAPAPVLQNLADVAVLTCRGTNGFVSISYGPQTNRFPARIMADIEPPAAAFPSQTIVTTPRLPGVIGLGALGQPTGGRLVNLVTNENGFSAELQLTNGAEGTTEVYFNDTGAGVGIVEVPHAAKRHHLRRPAAASFCTGIENDPLCGGSRLLEWNGGSATITNRTGVSRNMTSDWICVSGNYGITFGPGGHINYAAASDYARRGAAEDTLSFVPANSLAPRYAVYFPGDDALQTSNLAAQVRWEAAGTNALLTFPGADGAPAQITAYVPVRTR